VLIMRMAWTPALVPAQVPVASTDLLVAWPRVALLPGGAGRLLLGFRGLAAINMREPLMGASRGLSAGVFHHSARSLRAVVFVRLPSKAGAVVAARVARVLPLLLAAWPGGALLPGGAGIHPLELLGPAGILAGKLFSARPGGALRLTSAGSLPSVFRRATTIATGRSLAGVNHNQGAGACALVATRPRGSLRLNGAGRFLLPLSGLAAGSMYHSSVIFRRGLASGAVQWPELGPRDLPPPTPFRI